MSIKFYKKEPATETRVYGRGYTWRGNRDTYVVVEQGNESVSVTADEVPAFIDALNKAAVEANTQADKDAVERAKKAATKETPAGSRKESK